MVDDWAGFGQGLAAEVVKQSDRCLATYRGEPLRVREDAAIEQSIIEGGYARKQLYELIQNGADALLGSTGRIHVVLNRDCLYVANEGKALSPQGIESLMASHISGKRGDEIGRFGLGFKSVVAISDRPQVLSRSVSFGFEHEQARSRISKVVPDAPRYPLLRLAEPLDPHKLATEDSILAELMTWAATVVRVPLKAGYDDLAGDVVSFPSEFLLFSPHARRLTLEDRSAAVRRTVEIADASEGALTLDDDGRRSRWWVASMQHRPSKAALDDAGERAHRDTITVWWAVPMQDRQALGQFWAFFPTEDKTTLSGIVNAPWKMGDDRRNLLPGRFNEEILTEVLPSLISREWTHLLDKNDPSAHLDVLPARGREPRSWADGVINLPIFRRVASSASLPDVRGALRLPVELKLHPKNLNPELLELWSSLDPVPAGWVHHGVDSTDERRLKAERLIGDSERNRPPVSTWVEALCADGSVEKSATAIVLLDALVRAHPELAQDAGRAKVLLLEDGSHAAPVRGQVFVRSSPEESGFLFIHPDLAHLPRVVECLARLGIQVLDRAGELRNVLSNRRPADVDWVRAWRVARLCLPSVATTVFHEELPAPLETSVRVRNRSGQFVPLGMAYLPGAVVGPSDSANARACIDTAFHQQELELLTELGAVGQPTLRHGAPEEPWLRAYKDMIRDDFIAKARGAKPQVERLDIEGTPSPWPLEPLAFLSDPARLALTEVALGLTSGDPWVVRHRTNASYGRTEYINPVHWRVYEYGRLRTAFGPMSPRECILPSDGLPEDVLPVPDVTASVAEALQVNQSLEDLGAEAWSRMMQRARTWSDLPRVFRFYSWAVHFSDAPEQMLAQVGNRGVLLPPHEVAVVHSAETFQALAEQQLPAVVVDDEGDFRLLQQRWGLEDGTRLLEQELVFHVAGEPQGLVDRFPKLRLYLTPDQFDLEIQTCDSIDLVTSTRDGMRSKPVPHARNGNQLLVTPTDDEKALWSVVRLLQLDVDATDVRSILDHIQEQAVQELVAQLRNADSDDERLALLVGDERLRRALPASALAGIEESVGRRLDAVEMAQLVSAVHGVAALHHFRAVLEERGLNPPRQWAGGSAARRWVTSLGFAPELAGFSVDNRPAVFTVDGPADLAPLHDYQEVVTGRVKDLVRGRGPSRGMVSLPTGAGKTRVAVQALVEEIRDGDLHGPVMWIAQSDELCEQAVETWSYIWRAVGPRLRMTVSRLWGTNEATEVTDGFQLVVATPDKLNTKVGGDSYEWLRNPPVVVVDEAHTSVAPSYTRVLEWLGRRPGLATARHEHRPLIGLTATPFRNTNKEETERLAGRYDRNRLDDGAFDDDPYAELQRRGVLARVNHEVLKGVDVHFSSDEVQQIESMRFVPKTIESKLGEDLARNQRIVDSLAELPEDWTTLLFATSVENSRALAAQLTHRGIPAVAVSGDTDSAARRYYVEEFKRAKIRVITNYNVLTQGFDAPAVRAVYVTRPTFSANIYQQMIGRGLRGPLNGGSEEVLIVNVEDNFEQFGDRLAFYDFEYLWNPES